MSSNNRPRPHVGQGQQKVPTAVPARITPVSDLIEPTSPIQSSAQPGAPVEEKRKEVELGQPTANDNLVANITKAQHADLLMRLAVAENKLEDIGKVLDKEFWRMGDFVEIKPIKKILA